jgi:hypothetical protein
LVVKHEADHDDSERFLFFQLIKPSTKKIKEEAKEEKKKGTDEEDR